MTPLTFSFPTPIVYGAGSISEVGPRLKAMGVERPMILTSSRFDTQMTTMSGLVIYPWEFDCKVKEPNVDDVLHFAKRYHKLGCDSIVAIGGGSRIDLAKAVRFCAASNVINLQACYFDVNGLCDWFIGPLPPLICIPTTAGSGSEVSRGAVITDTTTGRKRLLAGTPFQPSLAILDPELCVSCPKQLTAECGLDAASHILECSVGSGFNPLAKGILREAFVMLARALPMCIEDGSNLQARGEMLLASSMAAMGFGKGLGLNHAVAHAIGSVTGMSHGRAVSIMLPHYLSLSEESPSVADVHDEYEALAEIGNVEDFVCSMARRGNVPATLHEAGVTREQLPEIAGKAMLDHCRKTSPREVTREAILEVLEGAME